MRNFFRAVLANIVAILIFCGIFFLLFFIFIAVSVAAADKKTTIKDNSILTIDSKTMIIESPADNQDNIFSFSTDKKQEVLAYDVIEAIKKAKSDPKIKGISIETDGITAGSTHLDNVRAAIEDFKKSKKFVYAYGGSVSQSAYYLGSVADQFFLHPAGGIEIKGLSAEVVYLKSFLDKYGIESEVIRHGKFKAAVEPFMRDDMSPENREQLSTILHDLWSQSSSKIAASRKMDTAALNLIADSLYSVIPANNITYKLADKLMQKSEYDQMLMQKVGVKEEKKLTKISVAKYAKSFVKNEQFSKDQVAVLYASGSILGGEGYDGIYAENFVKEIKKLADDKDVKAVVFRVNSPGGSANASDEILFELKKLKEKKPVVVSFGDYAASGGYYIAMGAERIFSEPNTVTGSIGVFGLVNNVGGLAKRNGISAHPVQTNSNSVFYSPINGLTAGARNMMTKSVEATYKRFVGFVCENRNKTFEQVDEIAGGRIWSGTRAKQLGLVDELGTLHDAVAYAAKKANMKEYSVAAYPKKMSKFEQIFKDFEEDQIAAKFIRNNIGEDKYKLFEFFTDPRSKSEVLMQMPFVLKFN